MFHSSRCFSKVLSPTAEGGVTQLHDLIDPEVMADLIIGKLERKIAVIPYAKVDATLQGRPGSTVKVPTYTWDGEAVEVPEGEEIPIRNLTSKIEDYQIKKIGIGTAVTDEALESGMGDPIGIGADGIAKSIYSKVDNDAMLCLMGATTLYDATAAGSGAISYANIMRGIDCFQEEVNSDKILYVHPLQVTQLRLDPDFISKEKYGGQVMMDGEIGIVGNARVIPSKRVPCIGGCFYNPILKTNVDQETELEVPALTYFLKRATNIETERKARYRRTEITGDQMYVVALTNDSRVVLLKTSGAPLLAKTLYERDYEVGGFHLDASGYKVDLKKTGDAAYTLNLSGKAPAVDAATASGVGLADGVTHCAPLLLSVPGAPLRDFDPAQVYVGSTACSGSDIRVVDGQPYLICLHGMKLSNGVVTGGTASLAVKYGASGETVTFTFAYNGLSLA